MKGFIKLHRSIIDWEWYQDKNTRLVFIHLLLTANYTAKPWRGQIIERGQLITSIKKLSHAVGLTTQQTRRALKNIQKSKEVTIKTTNKFTLLTIDNYNTYQDSTICENKQNNKQTTNKRTNKEQTTQQQLNNKRINKEKVIKKENNFLSNSVNGQTEHPDKRVNKNLPFDTVTAAQTIAEYNPDELIKSIYQIYQIEVTPEQLKTAAQSFAFVAVGTYDKYKGIRHAEKLKNRFIDWVPKNIKYNKRSKPKEAAQVGDLEKYYKNNYSKDWHLRNDLQIKQDLKNFSKYLDLLTEVKKELNNKTLDEIKIFYILFKSLGTPISASVNPKARLNSFKKWFYQLSDYKQKHGDIKQILKTKLDKQQF
tara:strand:+ start:142 stop:1239 length:1098 start_codon:yes stop_codon:yes gene_type:complete